MNKIKRIWKNRCKILEGLWYNHVVFFFNKKHWAKKVVDLRRIECYTCPYLDRDGSGEKAIVKGSPSCSICGCLIWEKTASLSSDCAMVEIGKEPRWKAVKVKNVDDIENSLND